MEMIVIINLVGRDNILTRLVNPLILLEKKHASLSKTRSGFGMIFAKPYIRHRFFQISHNVINKTSKKFIIIPFWECNNCPTRMNYYVVFHLTLWYDYGEDGLKTMVYLHIINLFLGYIIFKHA